MHFFQVENLQWNSNESWFGLLSWTLSSSDEDTGIVLFYPIMALMIFEQTVRHTAALTGGDQGLIDSVYKQLCPEVL